MSSSTRYQDSLHEHERAIKTQQRPFVSNLHPTPIAGKSTQQVTLQQPKALESFFFVFNMDFSFGEFSLKHLRLEKTIFRNRTCFQ